MMLHFIVCSYLVTIKKGSREFLLAVGQCSRDFVAQYPN